MSHPVKSLGVAETRMFGWAAVEEVETRCSANARANRRVTELLVSRGGGV